MSAANDSFLFLGYSKKKVVAEGFENYGWERIRTPIPQFKRNYSSSTIVPVAAMVPICMRRLAIPALYIAATAATYSAHCCQQYRHSM